MILWFRGKITCSSLQQNIITNFIRYHLPITYTGSSGLSCVCVCVPAVYSETVCLPEPPKMLYCKVFLSLFCKFVVLWDLLSLYNFVILNIFLRNFWLLALAIQIHKFSIFSSELCNGGQTVEVQGLEMSLTDLRLFCVLDCSFSSLHVFKISIDANLDQKNQPVSQF